MNSWKSMTERLTTVYKSSDFSAFKNVALYLLMTFIKAWFQLKVIGSGHWTISSPSLEKIDVDFMGGDCGHSLGPTHPTHSGVTAGDKGGTCFGPVSTCQVGFQAGKLEKVILPNDSFSYKLKTKKYMKLKSFLFYSEKGWLLIFPDKQWANFF